MKRWSACIRIELEPHPIDAMVKRFCGQPDNTVGTTLSMDTLHDVQRRLKSEAGKLMRLRPQFGGCAALHSAFHELCAACQATTPTSPRALCQPKPQAKNHEPMAQHPNRRLSQEATRP